MFCCPDAHSFCSLDTSERRTILSSKVIFVFSIWQTSFFSISRGNPTWLPRAGTRACPYDCTLPLSANSGINFALLQSNCPVVLSMLNPPVCFGFIPCLPDTVPVDWLPVKFEYFDAADKPSFVGLFPEGQPGLYQEKRFVVLGDVTIFIKNYHRK